MNGRLSGATSIVGRAREMAALDALLDQALTGEKRAAALVGPPGVGKTTLLRWLRAHGASRGFLAAYVRAPSTGGLPPRFPNGEILSALINGCDNRRITIPDPLRHVVDTLKGTTTPEQYPAALPQIAEAIEQTAQRAPVLVLIDDYQWAPADGVGVLIGAIRTVEGPVMVAVTARDEEEGTTLPEPSADLWFDTIGVQPFAESELESLVTTELQLPPLPELVAALYARTLGNPLLAIETLRGWRDAHALEEVAGHVTLARGTQPRTPRSLDELIKSRAGSLSSAEREVAEYLAILGRDAPFDVVRALTGKPAAELVDVLSALTEAGIVGADEDPLAYRIAHPLYQTHLVESMGATRRAAAHQDLHERLAGRADVVAAELAHHALRSLEPPPNLADLVERAATEAEEAGDFEEAARWYGHLADLVKDQPLALAAAYERHARTSINLDPETAVARFTQALELVSDPEHRARLLLGRAQARRVLGHFDQGLRDLHDMHTDVDTETGFRARHLKIILNHISGRTTSVRTDLEDLLEACPPDDLAPMIRGHLGVNAIFEGRLSTAGHLLRVACSDAEGISYEPRLLSNYAWVLTLIGEWSRADELGNLAVAICERRGDHWTLSTALSNLARLCADRGDFRSGLDLASRAIRIAERIPNSLLQAEAALGMIQVCLEFDSPQDAVPYVDASLPALAEDGEPQEQANYFGLYADCYLRLGDMDRADELLQRAWSYIDQAPHWRLALASVTGTLRGVEGRPHDGLQELQTELTRPSETPFLKALALETAARLSQQIGERSAALQLASEALHIVDDLGSAHRRAKLQGLVRDLTPPAKGRPRSVLPFGITPRELEVLELITQGKTNAEIAHELFLSVGTVRKHVENIMAKAGTSRRPLLVGFLQNIRNQFK